MTDISEPETTGDTDAEETREVDVESVLREHDVNLDNLDVSIKEYGGGYFEFALSDDEDYTLELELRDGDDDDLNIRVYTELSSGERERRFNRTVARDLFESSQKIRQQSKYISDAVESIDKSWMVDCLEDIALIMSVQDEAIQRALRPEVAVEFLESAEKVEFYAGDPATYRVTVEVPETTPGDASADGGTVQKNVEFTAAEWRGESAEPFIAQMQTKVFPSRKVSDVKISDGDWEWLQDVLDDMKEVAKLSYEDEDDMHADKLREILSHNLSLYEQGHSESGNDEWGARWEDSRAEWGGESVIWCPVSAVRTAMDRADLPMAKMSTLGQKFSQDGTMLGESRPMRVGGDPVQCWPLNPDKLGREAVEVHREDENADREEL